MKNPGSTVYVVDDNPSILSSIRRTLALSTDFSIQTFSSAKEFLNFKINNGPNCLVLDVLMSGLDGFGLQMAGG